MEYFGAKPLGERCVTMDIPIRLAPATVLLVEDEALVRLELAVWLEELGLIVLEAGDADEAIALLNIASPITCATAGRRSRSSSFRP